MHHYCKFIYGRSLEIKVKINYIKKLTMSLLQNCQAQTDFIRAFARSKRQDPLPIPSYLLPASQWPQGTQGRGKSLNPYDIHQ